MGYRPSVTQVDDDSLLIDEKLGAAYAVVKLVSENLPVVVTVGSNMSALQAISGSLGAINNLVAQLAYLETINEDIDNLEPIVANITQLLAIHANMANLLALHADLPALNTVYDNLSTFVDELVAVAGAIADVTAVAGNTTNINVVAGLQTAINGLPTLLTSIQAAADAAITAKNAAEAAVGSINLPLINPGVDGGKHLMVDPDLDVYTLQTPPASMSPDTYDPNGKAQDAFDADNHSDGTDNKVFTATERTKLNGISAGADVTSITNVGAAAAGAPDKAVPIDSDLVTGIDSVTNTLVKYTWTVIKAAWKATAANVYAAAANKFLTTDGIAAASLYVPLANSATPALNWEAGINRSITISQSIQLQNPTNAQPGTYRTILVKGIDSTPRSVTFGTNYLGTLPEIDDITDTKWYDFTIKCISVGHYTVTVTRAK